MSFDEMREWICEWFQRVGSKVTLNFARSKQYSLDPDFCARFLCEQGFETCRTGHFSLEARFRTSPGDLVRWMKEGQIFERPEANIIVAECVFEDLQKKSCMLC